MTYFAFPEYCAAIMAVVTALFVAVQERRSRVHWTFAAGMLLLAGESLCAGISKDAASVAGARNWQSGKFVVTAFIAVVWLAFSRHYGRNSGARRPGWMAWIPVASLMVACLVIGSGLRFLTAESPGQVAWPGRLNAWGAALEMFALIASLLLLINLEHTFRAAVGTVRWRIKYMVIGLGVLFGVRAYSASQALLYHRADPALDSLNAAALLAGCALAFRSLLRDGHFEVSVSPSRAVLQNSITVLLAGVYLVVMGFLSRLVAAWGDASGLPLKAFVLLASLVLLSILLLSDRARLTGRRFVSRHFQKPLHDYQVIWRAFTEQTTPLLEADELCRVSVRLFSEYFQALSATVWILDEKRERFVFAASTSLTEKRAASLAPSPAEAAEILRVLSREFTPVDLETLREPWAAALRHCQPDEFKLGGGRVCLPLVAGDEVLGLVLLGDRIAGTPFLQQDFDLMKCVGGHVAACLRNLQLARRLLQARELEAFQAMSAFFTHDLKNTASTLGLLLQNLPVHFNNPAFMQDALRGVSKTVDHINQLTARLATLRRGLELQPADEDLNEVVTGVLAGWRAAPQINWEENLRPLPRVALDRDQMFKVVTNLVVNAMEAAPVAGRIRVETGRKGPWVTLTVADNGCGMDADFLKHSLFRPFQSTKKHGFGIGMFQSRMIVEAHRGRLEVESAPGRGTIFNVFLPCHSSP